MRVHLAYVVEVAVRAGALLGRLVVPVVHQVQLEARLELLQPPVAEGVDGGVAADLVSK